MPLPRTTFDIHVHVHMSPFQCYICVYNTLKKKTGDEAAIR